MDYTSSPQNVVHQATGHRMHEDNQALPTVLTDADVNQVIWSLMEIVTQSGLAPQAFSADTPASYRVLREALKKLYVQRTGDVNLTGDYFTTGSMHALAFQCAPDFYMVLSGGNPAIAFDAGDFMSYDRTNNYFNFYANGVNVLYVGPADGPARINDATTANGLVRKSQMDRLWSVGDLKEATGTTAGSDWAAPVGQVLVRSSYPELWAFAQGSGNLAASEAEWFAGRWGAYSPGDGSTTFRVPDLRSENRSMPDLGRGIDGALNAGWKYDQSIQGHNHFFALHTEGGSAPGPRGVLAASDRGGDNGGTANTDGSNNYGHNTGYYTTGTGGAFTRQRGVSIPLFLKIR
jgi:microcystin-dependent protein